MIGQFAGMVFGSGGGSGRQNMNEQGRCKTMKKYDDLPTVKIPDIPHLVVQVHVALEVRLFGLLVLA